MNFKYAFLISLILVGSLFWFLLTSPSFQFFDMGSHEFCIREGYDSSSFLGEYSERFGKVKCVSCYNSKCVYEEFNVTRDWRGILHEEFALSMEDGE